MVAGPGPLPPGGWSTDFGFALPRLFPGAQELLVLGVGPGNSAAVNPRKATLQPRPLPR